GGSGREAGAAFRSRAGAAPPQRRLGVAAGGGLDPAAAEQGHRPRANRFERLGKLLQAGCRLLRCLDAAAPELAIDQLCQQRRRAGQVRLALAEPSTAAWRRPDRARPWRREAAPARPRPQAPVRLSQPRIPGMLLLVASLIPVVPTRFVRL